MLDSDDSGDLTVMEIRHGLQQLPLSSPILASEEDIESLLQDAGIALDVGAVLPSVSPANFEKVLRPPPCPAAPLWCSACVSAAPASLATVCAALSHLRPGRRPLP